MSIQEDFDLGHYEFNERALWARFSDEKKMRELAQGIVKMWQLHKMAIESDKDDLNLAATINRGHRMRIAWQEVRFLLQVLAEELEDTLGIWEYNRLKADFSLKDELERFEREEKKVEQRGN